MRRKVRTTPANWLWLNVTSSWAYQAATQWILGVRPEWDGLRVDPCIPSTWDGYRVQRHFRGARYDVTVRNPHHVCRGLQSVVVDGAPLAGNVIPAYGDGQPHHVEVVLG